MTNRTLRTVPYGGCLQLNYAPFGLILANIFIWGVTALVAGD